MLDTPCIVSSVVLYLHAAYVLHLYNESHHLQTPRAITFCNALQHLALLIQVSMVLQVPWHVVLGNHVSIVTLPWLQCMSTFAAWSHTLP